MARFFKAGLVCCVAALSLPVSALAAPEDGRAGNGFGTLAHTVLGGVIASTNANDALSHLTDGLALMEARRKLEESADHKAPAAADRPPAHDEPTVDMDKIVPGDPSTLPPASAGSNGTKVNHHSAAERQKIFANMRAGGGESTSILLTGIALPPPNAPQVVQDVIDNANAIVGRPYIWGGGHGSFYSHGYDCSGAVSFALFGGGLIPRPLTSGELEGWGEPGPGKWITVYANAGHTFATIAGLRWDTSGTESGTGPRWHLGGRSPEGFVVRHPPGL
jgi:cell wall-associated NlpC family hydrolase